MAQTADVLTSANVWTARMFGFYERAVNDERIKAAKIIVQLSGEVERLEGEVRRQSVGRGVLERNRNDEL